MVKIKWLTKKIVLVEKCTKRHAQTAEKKQKFLSSLMHQDLCIVEIVTKNTKNQEATTKVSSFFLIKNLINSDSFFFIFLVFFKAQNTLIVGLFCKMQQT